mmetsp:Transcript_16735/g.15093  ORF Transcript_16735/g.15093 Transcript_16735/m.15093 type:complete len:282 (+) Transcript_16735:17-862(+)
MGVVLTTAAPLDDYRVKKCIKTFDIPIDKIQILWNLFNRYDRERSGFISIDDFYNHILLVQRNMLTESMLDLIDSRSQEHLNFGEFVDIICTFACFEQADLIRFCFYALDNTKVGSVEKNEVKHFVYDMWENKVTSNIHTGLAYLDEHDDGDGRYNFNEFFEMHVKGPQIFYPVYKLQQQVMRRSLGELWWDWKKRDLLENIEERKLHEINLLRQQQLQQENQAIHAHDHLVKARMGIAWYLLPWMRKFVRSKVAKIAAINNELDEIENDDIAKQYLAQKK